MRGEISTVFLSHYSCYTTLPQVWNVIELQINPNRIARVHQFDPVILTLTRAFSDTNITE